MMANQQTKRSLPLTEYARELREWLQYSRQCQMMSFNYQPYAMITGATSHLSTSNNARQTQANATSQQPNAVRQGAENSPPRAFPVSAGTPIRVPSIGKRVSAEIIDCVILYVIKFCVTYLLVTYGGLKATRVYDFDYAFFVTGELDLEEFLQYGSEIMLVEFLHRLFVSVYEAACLTYVSNIIPSGGFTPGKKMMGICVIACDDVFFLGNSRFLVTGRRNPSLQSTLIRSFIKNFSLSVLVPTSLTALMFDHRRAVYDLVAGTVVIELDN